MSEQEFDKLAVLTEAQEQAYASLIEELIALNPKGLLVNLVFKSNFNKKHVDTALSVLRNADGAKFAEYPTAEKVELRAQLFYSDHCIFFKALFGQLERLERLDS